MAQTPKTQVPPSTYRLHPMYTSRPALCCQGGNRSSENLSDVMEATQLVNSGDGRVPQQHVLNHGYIENTTRVTASQPKAITTSVGVLFPGQHHLLLLGLFTPSWRRRPKPHCPVDTVMQKPGGGCRHRGREGGE